MHPDEGLQVYHVTRAQIAQVAARGFGEREQARVGLPGGLRLILKVEAVLARRAARDVGLEEDVRVGLRDEAEDGHERPCQDARLSSRQGFD